MAFSNGEDPLGDLEDRLRHEDPRFARAMQRGRPCRPQEYRHGRSRLLLVAATAVLGVGITLGNGLLIAAGLVGLGAAAHGFDPPRHPHGRPGPPPA